MHYECRHHAVDRMKNNDTSIINILTYNMQVGVATTRGYWHYATSSWKHLLPHSNGKVADIADFIRSEGIDIATFTEIDAGSFRTRGIDQVHRISELAGLKEKSFLPTYRFSRLINHGNSICSRYPILTERNYRLPGAGHPRYLGVATVRVGRRKVTVMVTHLALGENKRSGQIEYIAKKIKRTEGPVILAGDFNTKQAEEIKVLLDGTTLSQAGSYITYPSWRAKRSLDHIFLSPELTFVKGYVRGDIRFSDHLPVVAKVMLN